MNTYISIHDVTGMTVEEPRELDAPNGTWTQKVRFVDREGYVLEVTVFSDERVVFQPHEDPLQTMLASTE